MFLRILRINTDRVKIHFIFCFSASRVEASIEATKATIRGLLETLDKSSRVNLVNWMNRIELDSGKKLNIARFKDYQNRSQMS